MVVVLRPIYSLVRISVLTNYRAFSALFQLFQIYRSVNENRPQFLSSLRRDRDLEEKDSLSSFIKIKGCCLVVLCLFTSVE